MAICSYLVIPEAGAIHAVARRLAALPGCEVVRAQNRDVLILITSTSDPNEDQALRESLDGLGDIRALVLTFGQLDPHASDRVGGPAPGLP